MFDKYGEFNSSQELNAAAAGQLKEGDTAALFELAAENGIDKEDVQDYIDGAVSELATPLIAALGKIKVETDELKPVEIVEDWVNYITAQCTEHPEMAEAVRKKGKSIKGCIGKILKWSWKNSYTIDKDIVKAAGVNASVKMGIPGMGRAYEIIREYYLEA